MSKLSVIHIEDEFEEFESLVQFVAYWIEEYWESQSSEEYLMTGVTIAHSCKKTPPNWVIYELKVLDPKTELPFNDYSVRYIFVRDKIIPEEIEKYLLGERIFILDVLRPKAGETELKISIFETLENIQNYRNLYDEPNLEIKFEDVVIFTAYQGSELEQHSPSLPRIVDKSSEDGLENFLVTHLLRTMRNV